MSRSVRLIALLSIFLALPLSAARRRAFQPLPDATLRGIVTDAETGAPVIQAEVVNADRIVFSDADGKYQLTVPAGRPTPVTFRRTGYQTTTQLVTANGIQSLDLTMRSNPTVRVRTTSGTTYQLDYETAQFGTLTVFTGYNRTDHGVFCKAGGGEIRIDKSLIRTITGPGMSISNTACCTLGPVVAVNVELKDGTKEQLSFADSCFGNKVDFLGRDHTTAKAVFVSWTDIAEVTFP